ncbi:MAG TPA: hypothetical protein VF126_00655 [Acidobacteriaceae bacterium]|jgi:uncharacterized membrane protein YagU involved in acid resistance
MESITQAILTSTLLCGTFDGIAASAQAATLRIPISRVWKGVASGLLGSCALETGSGATAALGLVLHFFISLVISTIYVLAALHVPFLIQRPFLAGALYGITVFLVMNFVVLPLSRRPKRPFNLKFAATQLVIHIVVVGWSIALSAHHFLAAH